MDLKKEIKLSDLVRRPQKKTKAPAHKPSGGAPRKRGRKQEIVGLKIGASQIAASRVVNNGGRAELVQLARIPLEPGVVVAGEVRDLPALASALAELFRTNKLPRRGVRLGIATNRIGVRSFELEGIEDERQLANAIRFRAYEELSIPADEAVLDYHVVSEGVNEAGQRSRRVVLAAAYRDSIDRYVAACKEAGIEVAAVDLEAFALLRAVAPAAARDEQAAVVAVTIGHDRTTLAISDGVVCDFTRVLEWGGANLEDAIARELGLSADEARQLMLALDLGDDASDGDDPSLARARAVLARELQTLARELIASLRFYQSQPGSLAISTVADHRRHDEAPRPRRGARAPDARACPAAPTRSPACRSPTRSARVTTWRRLQWQSDSGSRPRCAASTCFRLRASRSGRTRPRAVCGRRTGSRPPQAPSSSWSQCSSRSGSCRDAPT